MTYKNRKLEKNDKANGKKFGIIHPKATNLYYRAQNFESELLVALILE